MPYSHLGIFDLGMMNACEVVDADGTVHIEIMDGQQRMVTICLIYAAIRKILVDRHEEDYSKTVAG